MQSMWLVFALAVLGCSSVAASTTFRCLDGAHPIDVSWDLNENVICFTVTADCGGPCWVGLAFNNPYINTAAENPMTNADYYIATYSGTNGTGQLISVDDSFAVAKSHPSPDTTFAGCQANAIIPPMTASQVDGVSTYSFCRLLDTGDALCDHVLQDTVGVLCARGTSNTFGYHSSNRAYVPSYVFTYDVESGGNPINPETPAHYVTWHAGFMFLAFGVLMPWGSFVSRYLKSYWWWFPLHIVIQMLAVILSVVAFIIIVTTIDPDYSFTFIHAYIGLATLILAWLSPVLGLISHLMWDPQRKSVPVFPDMVHWYVARLAILFGFASIYLGIIKAEVDTLVYVFTVLVVFYFVALVAIEVAQRFNKNSYEVIN